MRVVILHNAVPSGASPDVADVLAQVEAVEQACRALGHTCMRLECSADMPLTLGALEAMGPEVVVNLVEEVDGQARLAHVVPAFLEARGLAFSGSGSVALLTSGNKLLAKERMRLFGVPTPDWRCLGGANSKRLGWERAIIKSVWEHASHGLDDASVVEARRPERLQRAMEKAARRMGGEVLAERFLDGREFNLAALETSEGLRMLPPAEMRFAGAWDGKPKIVGYRAKWDEDSAESRQTVRCYDVEPHLAALLQRLLERVWQCFGLAGYARVDVRLDNGDRPQVIDVNANPCLSPDAGFAAAVAQADLRLEEAVACILAAALKRGPA